MSKDPYKKLMRGDACWKASERAMRNCDAEIGRVQGDLNSFVASGDKDSAAVCVTELANLSRQKESLQLLRHQCVASKTLPQAPAKTPEEIAATPIEALNSNELFDVYRGSKYAKDLDWNDPNVRGGWVEAQNRRARGQ
jgi:hypothetical protein